METFVDQAASMRTRVADIAAQNAHCTPRALGRDAIRDLIARARDGERPRVEG